ncbi:MAG: tetratricopeptide repeat protein [Flavobacteriales bacterium]
MAVGNQGDALVELGHADEAVKLFEKAASMEKNDLTTPMYLMKAGIIHQQASNWSAAAKAFNRIATEFPASTEANTARKYAGHAKHWADSPFAIAMATAEHNLSNYDPTSVPGGAGLHSPLW